MAMAWLSDLTVGELWSPISLTLMLASLTTLILLVAGTPIAWWLARSKARWKARSSFVRTS